MLTTYRAMQVSTSGLLELVDRPVPTPDASDVLIQVEACGICGADIGDIEGANPELNPPRVPGHEVVGRIIALGEKVSSRWTVGQRVGVGRLGGHCNECNACRQGKFQLCGNQSFVGASCDGGYAEMMLIRHTGLVAIPDDLDSVSAAPILCAGIATFNGLKKSGATAGDLIVVQGVGGLGHMAIQYANKMGFNVVAVGRGKDIEADAKSLGAHHYIDSNEQEPLTALKDLGGARAILTTITDAKAVSDLFGALLPDGCLMVLGVSKEPLTFSAGSLVGGERKVRGSLTGTPFEIEKTLSFSLLTDSLPVIETLPLEKANEAYLRMKSGDVKFRMVLTV